MITNTLNGVSPNTLPNADHYPTRIRKRVKNKHDFKDIKVPVKIRDIHKTEKKNCISVTVFDY